MPTINNFSKIGQLGISAYEGFKTKPISNAKIFIYDAEHRLITTLSTDISGQTEEIPLNTPDQYVNSEASDGRPYSIYSIKVEAEGYNQVEIQGVQMFGDVKSIQEIPMTPAISRKTSQAVKQILIPDHVLYGNYPPKIPEPLKTGIPTFSRWARPYLAATIIPQFVQVHAGPPNQPAPNYTIPYKDYIKNVACCEIYPNWHKEALKANILCIISFTLNRIRTERYRAKGFTITSSTRYDHAYAHGRTIFQPIIDIVDEIFDSYISIGNLWTPFLAQYSSGRPGSPLPTHSGWLSQHGSQFLAAKRNYNYLQIINYYYEKVLEKVKISKARLSKKAIPESYPGHILKNGSTEKAVKIIQNQLNTIAKNYPAIPKLAVNEVFDLKTETAVKIFQKIAKMPQTGMINRATWYRISDYYVAIRKLETPKPQYTLPPHIY
jgi:hypothetical protein